MSANPAGNPVIQRAKITCVPNDTSSPKNLCMSCSAVNMSVVIILVQLKSTHFVITYSLKVKDLRKTFVKSFVSNLHLNRQEYHGHMPI